MLFIAALLAGAAASGSMRDHVPLSKKELASRMKMTRYSYDCPLVGSFQVGAVTFHPTQETLQISGVDKSGKAWMMLAISDNCAFWHGDLDADGVEDFVFKHRTGFQMVELVIVLFDSQRRAVPWVMKGDFETDENGLFELLDLNGDGRAELLWTSWVRCSKPKCWATELYESQGGYWHRVRGQFAGRTFPMGEVNPGALPDLSNTFGDTRKFETYKPKVKDECLGLRLPEAEGTVDAIDECHEWVVFEGSRACEAPSVVIFDSSDGRYIGRSRMLSRAAPGAPVRMAGSAAQPSGCAPMYMWVMQGNLQ